ncbi:HAD family phosphatase [Faecalicatena contorta]|uniref:HAD family hydrolase n=1 Tax=Faecalicatena contorta TaxID=39482 RepID=UPI00129DAEBE|nr:HAD family phosphatase [Faecalicatena contorta]MRM90958.1 HAD family phosphatase [Faecalicatena contorta]
MKKAVIFDMDGLMIDSERLTWEGYQKECLSRGYEMTLDFYMLMLGHPMAAVRKMMREHFGDSFPMEEIIHCVHDRMEFLFSAEGVPKKPGLMEILRFTKENRYLTMVATSSDRARVERILRYAEIEAYFDDIICGDEVVHGKPSPDIFLNGCNKLGVRPEEAYVIEDSEMGILAAHRAGIAVICVPDMKQPEEKYRNMALCVVPSLSEAKAVLESGGPLMHHTAD